MQVVVQDIMVIITIKHQYLQLQILKVVLEGVLVIMVIYLVQLTIPDYLLQEKVILLQQVLHKEILEVEDHMVVIQNIIIEVLQEVAEVLLLLELLFLDLAILLRVLLVVQEQQVI